MNDENADKPAAGPRIITASKYNGAVPAGSIEIHAYTKHGDTALISVMPPTELSAGDTLKTQVWIMGAKQFVVVGEHTKPMKLPGVWYQVRVVKQAN